MDASALYIVLLVACIITSAFFSSAETAFISLPKTKIRHMVSSNVMGADRIDRLTDRPERLLATVLLCNNFVNVAAAALGTVIAVSIWGGELGVLLSTIGVTILLLIFAEVTPKTFATRHAERMALVYVYPIQAITWLVSPLAVVLGWIGSTLSGGRGSTASRALVSEEEIRTMISVGREEGTVERAEADMLSKVFQFGDRSVREVTTPRPEVTWIEEGTRLCDFLAIYAEAPHSRFPVYRDNVDNVIGILSIKDVLMAQARGALDMEGVVSELVRPVEHVPETKRISHLFAEMQSRAYQMAVVVDEYGVTTGIVTVEQLLEEIVGRVGDELVVADKDFEFIDERTVQIDGGMRVEEANEELGLDIPDGEYDTVGGFFLSMVGHIPKEGEQIRHGALKMVVTQMRGMRIEKILVTRE